ncbi:MAG: hypothetical protein E6I17_06605 [Chloroflexi bacterium]|nr:MAG: hypothetical protein E6I17_06605 [Chloroflexota bacterium]
MTKGLIATPHHTASEVGAQILRDGGNAIDAAIAADAVLCVVYPHMTSVGGDLMAIVWAAGETSPVGLIGAGRSGELATIDAVRSRGFDEMPARGALSVTVPGTVEAWGRLLERFGSVGLGAVLEPAAALAREGYIISPDLSARGFGDQPGPGDASLAMGRTNRLSLPGRGRLPAAATDCGLDRSVDCCEVGGRPGFPDRTQRQLRAARPVHHGPRLRDRAHGRVP